jgi:ABC-2 type transport system permease protein
MLRHIKLYGAFIRICLVREMEARGNFLVNCVLIFCFPLVQLLFVGAIYSKTGNLNGWTLYQYLTLLGSFQIVSALVFTMFFRNIFEMPDYIRKGQLDFYLLKPVNSQFMITTRYLAITEFSQAIPGIILLIVGVANLNTTIDWWQWLLYPVFIACGVVICYSIWFIMVIPCIWWVKMDLAEFFFNLFDTGRYHPNMFGGAVKVIMIYILPFGVVASTPSDLLLGRLSWAAAGWTLAVTAGLLFLSSRFWRFASAHYYGASA